MVLFNQLFDYSDRNEFLEQYQQVLKVPDKQDILRTDPDYYKKRLAEISSPSQRLKEFLFDLVNIYGTDRRETHETRWTRNMFIAGASVGWIAGGIMNSRGLHEEFIRKNNASVYNTSFHNRRHRLDTFLYTVGQRGAKRGLTTGLLCASVGVISFGSINYRNELYYPDWAVGFTIIGALSRLWVSPRAIAMGGALGLLAGSFGYGLARLEEMVSGISVTQMRYLNHIDYVKSREERLPWFQSMREDFSKDLINNIR